MCSRITLLITSLLLIAQSGTPQSFQVKWGEDIALTESNRDAWSSRVVTWDDAVHVIWKSYDEYWTSRIYYRPSFDRGDTWYDQVQVSPWGLGEPVSDSSPAIAVWRDAVYVVFKEHNIPTSFTGTAYSVSSDSGQTWYNPPLELIEDGWHPAISVWRNYVNVVAFTTNCVFHRISTDGGITFQPQDTLANLDNNYQPSYMRAYQNYVFLTYRSTWDSTNTAEVFFQRSTNYGETFEPYIMLSTEGMNHSQLPSMDITDNGDVYVIWMDYRYSPYPTTGDVLMRHSPDFGEHWEDEVQVTFTHYASYNSIAAEGSQVHVVWQDGRWGNLGEEELYYCYSDNFGQIWSNEIRLTNANHRSVFPRLCQNGDTLHLVWSDERDGICDQIYYKRGLVRYPLSTVPQFDGEQHHFGITEQKSIPANPMLTAHPNPFNAETVISFVLPEAGQVTLEVFDIRGRRVGSVQDRPLRAGWMEAGSHEVTFDASNLASGIYLYRLEAGEFTASGKMVLMK